MPPKAPKEKKEKKEKKVRGDKSNVTSTPPI
jgi:hypothetical protein